MKKWKADGNYRMMGLTAFFVVAASMLFYFLLFRTKTLGIGIAKVISVINPILYGFIIAYILMPVMQCIENLVYKVIVRAHRKPSPRVCRTIHLLCCIFALVLAGLIVYGLFAMIIPQLITSIRTIVVNFQSYIDNINGFIDTWLLKDNQELDEKTTALITEYSQKLYEWLQSEITPLLNRLAGGVTNSVLGVATFVKNILLGAIISLYVMIRNDVLLARFRRLVYALFTPQTGNRILRNLRFADEKFGGFFIGKVLDSAIIGVITYICCLVMKMPYTVLISVVIGVTNIIPFFGPFIGAVPSSILIFVENPLKALIFIVFILILQQFDGNFLGPRILGSSVGVSSFMVILSILIGSGFFGVTGMVVAVPACAVITALVQTAVLRRMMEKHLPGDLESYHNIDMINPINGEFIPLERKTGNLSMYDKLRMRNEEASLFVEPLKEMSWEQTREQLEREDAEIDGTAYIKTEPEEVFYD